MKKIMVLGAGRGQVDLINAILKYGYEPIIASIKGNYPGLNMGLDTVDVDISDSNAVLVKARELQIDAVVIACMDLGISSLGYVCDNMGLSGLSAQASKMCENKYLMKQAFIQEGVNTAKYEKVSSETELLQAAENLNYPLILKAVDLQGSRGINIVRDPNVLLDAYASTLSESKEEFCILEEFLEGDEFSVQAFIANGEVIFVLPCGDETFSDNANVPVGHYAPLNTSDQMNKLIFEQTKKAIKAVGLDNCAVNLDAIYKDETIYVIELTGRTGANCLPQLTSIYYGIDIYKMILDIALGKNPKQYFDENKKDPTPCYARMIFSDKSGKLKKINNSNTVDENIVETTFFVSTGDKINQFCDSRDCIGQVVVKSGTMEKCKQLIDKVCNNIIVELE